jgi:hypothetical protein
MFHSHKAEYSPQRKTTVTRGALVPARVKLRALIKGYKPGKGLAFDYGQKEEEIEEAILPVSLASSQEVSTVD